MTGDPIERFVEAELTSQRAMGDILAMTDAALAKPPARLPVMVMADPIAWAAAEGIEFWGTVS